MKLGQVARCWTAPLALAVCFGVADRLSAATVVTGDVTPALPWSSSSTVRVGATSSGALHVDGGTQLATGTGYLGYALDASGEATVTGNATQWNNNQRLSVGYDGAGQLLVAARGQVQSSGGTVGARSTGTGAATITGLGSRWDTTSGTLEIGSAGSGILRVENEGVVNSFGGFVGTLAGADGRATITGLHSLWTVGGTLEVARSGQGTLVVENSARVTNVNAIVGKFGTATGSVVVTGAGSQWTSASNLYLGEEGRGSMLVAAGGMVNSSGGNGSIIGFMQDSFGQATVIGAGSRWNAATAQLVVGQLGEGILSVADGGMTTCIDGYIGRSLSGVGTATVTGIDSCLTSANDMNVGHNGRGTITVANSGLVSIGGTLTIDQNGGDDSFVNLATGGMLALSGDADDSLAQFLGLVQGTDAIRYWSDTLAAWAPLTSATLGIDYTLEYLTTGDLAGYTLLTVGTLPVLDGDFNVDGVVEAADYTVWRDGLGTIYTQADYDLWKANFGNTYPEFPAAALAPNSVPEPSSLWLAALCTAIALRGVRARKEGQVVCLSRL